MRQPKNIADLLINQLMRGFDKRQWPEGHLLRQHMSILKKVLYISAIIELILNKNTNRVKGHGAIQ